MAPKSGASSSAPLTPPNQKPTASAIGSPAMNCGTTVLPTWYMAKPPKVMPFAPPNAEALVEIGSYPWPAIQVANCMYEPGSRLMMRNCEW